MENPALMSNPAFDMTNGLKRPARKQIRRSNILDVLGRSEPPITIRNIYYQLLTFHGWPKDRNAYHHVSRDMKSLREDGEVPFDYIIDSSRAPVGFTADRNRTAEHAVAEAAANAQPITSPWAEHGIRPQLWVESASAGGNLIRTADEYQVSLWQSRGQSSITFIRQAVLDGPTHIGMMVDRDTAGMRIAAAIETTMSDYTADMRIYDETDIIDEDRRPGFAEPPTFDFLAVTTEQIEELNLESHPDAKTGEPKWELESIAAPQLRQIAAEWLENLLPPNGWAEYQQRRTTAENELRQVANQVISNLGFIPPDNDTPAG